jgi:hypothetical protein
VYDTTLLDSWVISAQGHFTKNTDLFPVKISKSLNAFPMKAVVHDNYSKFTMYSNGTLVSYITVLEMKLLWVVLQQMNMTFIHVLTSELFVKKKGWLDNLITSMIALSPIRAPLSVFRFNAHRQPDFLTFLLIHCLPHYITTFA